MVCLKGFRTQCVPAELAWSGVTDGLEQTQCCLLSSPSACVSPSDPTLTVENVREVMAEVGNWVSVGSVLVVPYSKVQEISQQSSAKREKCLALGDYWVNTDPDASWERLARALYHCGEERALAVAKQYLQQGMCVLVACYGSCDPVKIINWETEMKIAPPDLNILAMVKA